MYLRNGCTISQTFPARCGTIRSSASILDSLSSVHKDMAATCCQPVNLTQLPSILSREPCVDIDARASGRFRQAGDKAAAHAAPTPTPTLHLPTPHLHLRPHAGMTNPPPSTYLYTYTRHLTPQTDMMHTHPASGTTTPASPCRKQTRNVTYQPQTKTLPPPEVGNTSLSVF